MFYFCPASFVLSQHNPMKLSLLFRATSLLFCFELFFDNISLNFVPVRLQKITHICLSLIAFGLNFSPGRLQTKVIHMRSTTLLLLISTGMTLAWTRWDFSTAKYQRKKDIGKNRKESRNWFFIGIAREKRRSCWRWQRYEEWTRRTK